MRMLQFVIVLLLGAIALPQPARATDETTVRAILFVASNEKGDSDRRLAPYEPTLRSVLRFESYRFLSQTSAKIPASGTTRMTVQGQPIEIESEKGRVRVTWNGTTVVVPPGKPVVLGGRPHGDRGEVSGVIVTVN